MTCSRCQAQNPEDARFCEECGAGLALVCPQCGAEISPGKKFCRACGAALSGRAPDRPVSPASYTPKHLAEKILTSKSALEGERKQVTVLFADLKGSMELLADRDPEEARKLLDPVLERMMEAVHHYEGTVNQVMGDGIMALFGAPIGHEDHAVRACYGALRMQRRVALYADELQRGGGTPVQIRVGLNSGEVVVRAIGSDLHMDYTAVGLTTHLAARMEQMAKPGSVLVTGDTLRLAENYVQVRPLGSIPVKGLETPAPVYELTGTVPARSRFQATADRGLTHFVGRERELEQLGQALERAAAGHGQTVAIVGEAGVGKSRLVWEVTHSHRTHGWLVLECGSVSYGKATPYLPVIDLLRAYCRIQERDDPRAIRERVAGKLLMLDRALEPLLTPLLALLDVPVEDAAWEALDPPRRRQRTLEAVKRLLLRESQVQPVLVVFEDLHWIDSETQALLDSLVESLPTARLLLLVNYRPEYQHAWGGKTYYLQLRIDPLLPQSAEELLNALLGDDRTLAPLTRMLIARTEGNPFFLEESVRTLVETQVLVGKRGAYRMAKAPDAWQIPATAQAILAARIDRLPPEMKRLLQAASVIGKDVRFPLLQAIAVQPEDTLRQGLRHLQAAEFLYETSLFPDLEYTFKHALTHEVAYGSLLHARRRALHAQLVHVIERIYADRPAEQVESLAHHALRGELWDKALAYLRQAGVRALGRSAHREAAACFEQAVVAVEHLGRDAEAIRTSIDLRTELRTALYPFGDVERIRHHLRVGEQLAQTLADRRREGWMVAFQAHLAWSTGHPVPAMAEAERVLAIAETEQDLGLKVVAAFFLGQACHAGGDYRRGIEVLERAIEEVPGDLVRERFGMGLPASVVARVWLAMCLAEVGRFGDGLMRGQEAVRITEAVAQQPYSDFHSRWAVGIVYLAQGDIATAIPTLERALAVARDGNLHLMAAAGEGFLGYAYLLAGRTVEAIAMLDPAVEWSRTMRFGFRQFQFQALLAEARLRNGEADEAARLTEEAVDLCRRHGQRGWTADALRIQGDIFGHSARGRVDAAVACYREALALAADLGMRPLVAHCHLGLGKLYRRTGDRAKAEEHLTTARAMYREMGMSFWLEKAEAVV
jgi:class 3 adenylate cyclase/tetratricopeptide (TPR) repeat protein